MRRIEWFGRTAVTDEMYEEIEARLKRESQHLPYWMLTKERLVIHEWESDWKPAPFELRFNTTYSKGLVYEGYGEKEEKRFSVIQDILKYINENTSTVTVSPRLDLDSGFVVFENN